MIIREKGVIVAGSLVPARVENTRRFNQSEVTDIKLRSSDWLENIVQLWCKWAERWN